MQQTKNRLIMANKLIVSLSPHAHGTDSVERNMYGVIIALLPALLVSFLYFGIGSAIVCASSVIACVFFEWAISKYILKRDGHSITDGSAVITGLLLGMNLPSNLPVWIIVIGALVAIGIGKMTFGGLGNNPFNPALVGRCFLLISFPAQMTSWPLIGQLGKYTDATTGATPLSIMKTAIKSGDSSVLDKLPHVYIHKDTSITGAAYDALRVAITYPVSTTTNSTIIFGKTAENGITDPYTTKAIITEGAFTYGNIPSNYYTNQLVRTFDNKNGGRATSDTTIIDTNKILFTIPANTRMLVNLKIWLEGGDTECTNSIASTYLDVLFEYGCANELSAAPDVSGVSSNHTITGLTTAMEWSTVNDNSATWTRVTDASQTFTDYSSLYVRIAEDVGVTPESYATLVTF